MFVLGLDVGYSNLKLAFGDAPGAVSVLITPAGAAPVDRLGERLGGKRASRAADILVEVDGRVSDRAYGATGDPGSGAARAAAVHGVRDPGGVGRRPYLCCTDAMRHSTRSFA